MGKKDYFASDRDFNIDELEKGTIDWGRKNLKKGDLKIVKWRKSSDQEEKEINFGLGGRIDLSGEIEVVEKAIDNIEEKEINIEQEKKINLDLNNVTHPDENESGAIGFIIKNPLLSLSF